MGDIATSPQALSAQGFDHRLSSLERLPEELLQLIVSYLPTPALKHASLVSGTLMCHATDILWRSVCLVDQRTSYLDLGDAQAFENGAIGPPKTDEHDDTPIIQKLFILASNPTIASKVQVLSHRCHLPPPNIFDEIPHIHFHSENLSQDVRTHKLLRLAVRNMVNVHTVHIIYGHMKLASTLVAAFLDHDRPLRKPLRRLWLESCALTPYALNALASSRIIGLESLRVRRLDAASSLSGESLMLGLNEYRLARGATSFPMHDGAGNWIETTVQLSPEGMPDGFHQFSDSELMLHAQLFDLEAWSKLPAIEELLDTYHELDIDELMVPAPVNALQSMCIHSASTLTSLNLDWILWRRNDIDNGDTTAILEDLATLRFPHLRAFQLRNAVTPQTLLPHGIYLLEDTFLAFMEYHHKLQCLAWPADRFFGHTKPSIDVQNRVRALVAHLATVLTDLRIDAGYVGQGEPLTDGSYTVSATQECIRRRRFIAEFAPSMRRIARVKMEGGLPRDEKRELLRALHYCPLEKIVMIGVSCPAGNTWGRHGLDLKAIDEGSNLEDMHDLEAEDYCGIAEAYRRDSYMPEEFIFEASYGWPAVQDPLLQTTAFHHASTVKELKLCGFHGCPILSHPIPITDALLAPLRCFDNLKQLVMSFWLLTWFEDDYRDAEVIKFWKDSRSPSSTALVVVTPPRSPHIATLPVDTGQLPYFGTAIPPAPHVQDENRWASVLKTCFSPSAIAHRVAHDIGPYLSPLAKNQRGGVRVRANFCVGVKEDRRSATDIFDMDIRIGAQDQVLNFTGPREEVEPSRWQQKLNDRSWF